MKVFFIASYNYLGGNMFNKLIRYINPKDSLLSISNDLIHIYNYNKIIDINSDSINIVLDNKLSTIKGSNFKIIKMENEELLIKGNVNSIEIK